MRCINISRNFALVNIVGLGINEIVFVLTDKFLFEPIFVTLGLNPAVCHLSVQVVCHRDCALLEFRHQPYLDLPPH